MAKFKIFGWGLFAKSQIKDFRGVIHCTPKGGGDLKTHFDDPKYLE